MKLKTGTGDVFFNPHLISKVHLSPDHSLLTVHFVNGTVFTSPAETDEERTLVADFLVRLTEEHSGFLAIGKELLNLKSALWISIPDDAAGAGPGAGAAIQVRSADNRTHTLQDEDPARIRKVMGE